MNLVRIDIIAALGLLALPHTAFGADGDATRGQRIFRACAACHSLEADKNMTGPSLSGLFGRKAGSLTSFSRYSTPLKSSGVIWNDETLDQWIADPQHVVPGNQMTFPGVKDRAQRSDLLAFLKETAQPGRALSSPPAHSGGMMGGMMGGGATPNLKKLDADERVQTITHCNDTYRVITANGKIRDFWERNLRFKTDTSDDGPQKGTSAILGAGMMGDRADVIFAGPEEIASFIRSKCE